MKMSDVWGESFELTYGSYPSPHHGADAYGMMFTSEEPCKAICHAVNNHDVITKHNHLLQLENEQLAKDKEELFEAFNDLKEIALEERKWRLEDCEELCHLEIDESLSILSGRINGLLEKHKCD